MAGPTLRLFTLGGLTLERDGQPIGGIGNRKVPLILLALLAGHGAQGISRDKLVAYLWPDSDEARARNSLKQVLFGLRRELGDSLLTSAGPTLRLDPCAIGSDLADFDAATVAHDQPTPSRNSSTMIRPGTPSSQRRISAIGSSFQRQGSLRLPPPDRVCGSG